MQRTLYSSINPLEYDVFVKRQAMNLRNVSSRMEKH